MFPPESVDGAIDYKTEAPVLDALHGAVKQILGVSLELSRLSRRI